MTHIGKMPVFTTAPRIQLRIGDTKIAYAIGINLNIAIEVQPINVIGTFGPVALEPTMYNPVTGTVQIIKLMSKDTLTEHVNYVTNTGANTVSKPSLAQGVSVDAQGRETYGTMPSAYRFNNNSPVNQYDLFLHLNPGKILSSQTFNMDFYMYVPEYTSVTDPSDPTSEISASVKYTEVPWLRIEDVRLTSRSVNITLGQLVNEPVNFQGLLATPLMNNEGKRFERDYGPNETQ